MRTTFILFLALAACDTATPVAPEAPQAELERTLRVRIETLERSLAQAAAALSEIKNEQVALRQELDSQVEAVYTSVDGHVTVLKSASVDLSEGTCAMTREAGSGLATGRRQHAPLILQPTDLPVGTRSAHGDPIHGVDVKLGLVDANRDGVYDYVGLQADIDADGFLEIIEIGGDRDNDGDLTDDALEADRTISAAGDRVCGATNHF